MASRRLAVALAAARAAHAAEEPRRCHEGCAALLPSAPTARCHLAAALAAALAVALAAAIAAASISREWRHVR